jgi:cell division GTPase FtsZ
MIKEDEVEKAVIWLAQSADKAAQARANREYMDEYRRTIRATIMAENKDQPLAAQERDAYRDPRYVEHLEAFREAVHQDEKMRWLRIAAETKISVWQSQQRAVRV